MKKMNSLVSAILLVTLTFIQLVQAAHHHDESHHYSKNTESSSQHDLQLLSTKCFLCTFHSSTSLGTAILPAELSLAFYKSKPQVLATRLNCVVNTTYRHTSYNKGPPANFCFYN